jgi:CBS domain-containing protein
MQVREILDRKGHDVATISQERSVSEGLAMLRERGIGALVVTGMTPPLAGIFSERDIVRALAERGADVLDESIAELMSTDITTCTSSSTVDAMMSLMTEQRIRHVPVVDDGVLTGMVSIGDVVKSRVDELEHDKRDLIEYVTAR